LLDSFLQERIMSSLIVLCPNGHRQKVPTNPNMSLQQVIEIVCSKKGFDPSRHKLQHHRKTVDLSNSVRFSGIPNNSTLELVELGEDEVSTNQDCKVTVCLQVEGGERLISEFSSTSSLLDVVHAFPDKLGEKQEGEEMVVVYMRNEVVGQQSLSSTSLRTLGLTSGKGLFRFFYKKPEVLKDQAKVYSMKVVSKPEEEKPEKRHLPMRLEPSTLSQQPGPEETSREEKMDQEPAVDPIQKEAQPQPGSSKDVPTTADLTEVDMTSQDVEMSAVPDSTSQIPQEVIEAVGLPVGPNAAIIFSSENAAIDHKLDIEDDDEFFKLSIDEVKGLYKEMKLQVKELSEGSMLLTKEMRESQKEGEKLSLLGRYKWCVLRVQFPDRHVVQGIFGPATTLGDVMTWLAPLLLEPDTPFELYTAPPRTVLDQKSSLLDLNLFPAALVHFSSKVTRAEPSFLKPEFIQTLSNIQGANQAASQYRKGGARAQTGISGEFEYREPERLETIPESRSKRGGEPSTRHPGASKLPKWFKPAK